jgi:hypothetical protein
MRVVLSGLLTLLCLAGLARSSIDALWVWAAYVGIAISALYLASYLRRETGRRQIIGPLLAAIGALIFWWLSATYYLTANLWYVPGASADQAAVSWERTEPLLFEQADKIDAAVAATRVDSSKRAQAFFVGFAGYGEQRVFADEIAAANTVISRRYAASERSIRLINDERDLNRYPLATVSGLARALNGIAKRMDTEADVLFLSLSSHSSDNATLSVSNGSMPLAELTSQRLADMLRASGIRWTPSQPQAYFSAALESRLQQWEALR